MPSTESCWACGGVQTNHELTWASLGVCQGEFDSHLLTVYKQRGLPWGIVSPGHFLFEAALPGASRVDSLRLRKMGAWKAHGSPRPSGLGRDARRQALRWEFS